ncbi:siderophore-interacting protein [Tsukamurella sp. 8F]|uniref:siderophore-interacting protein n=1 Tax=unclassified Tsukamurella TaxID=2633480 RepID=UPI0023B8CFBC|nr:MULTISPECIES: siderophore-interacting protein [unclassified Tsukamurella]MDF0528732.1 siderophore-interacting protein [Tsukamurella sp. 8J]MDF0585694.1 siderophore-interacting protein [Tsukamurella sp. 8F]
MPNITSRLADIVGEVVLTSSTVTAVDRLTPNFALVDLACPSFRKARWTPGAKLQLRTSRGLQMRTYTPIRWDTDLGETTLLGWTREHGPGAQWFVGAAVGDECDVFGPRRSIDLTEAAGEVVFIGDEASIGLACALHTLGSSVRYVLEGVDTAEVTEVFAASGLPSDRCTVVPAGPDRAQLLAHAREAADVASGDFDVVVTGNAATVHAVRRDARGWRRQPRKVIGKAYWAEGRTGLD